MTDAGNVELRRTDGTVIEGAGESGMLYIAGESICTGYWCRTEVNRMVFHGEWMRTGDQYVRGDDGSLTWAVVTVDELPKTATGKIQRFRLRAQAALLPTVPRPGVTT